MFSSISDRLLGSLLYKYFSLLVISPWSTNVVYVVRHTNLSRSRLVPNWIEAQRCSEGYVVLMNGSWISDINDISYMCICWCVHCLVVKTILYIQYMHMRCLTAMFLMLVWCWTCNFIDYLVRLSLILKNIKGSKHFMIVIIMIILGYMAGSINRFNTTVVFYIYSPNLEPYALTQNI